jgi:hypothetical protein
MYLIGIPFLHLQGKLVMLLKTRRPSSRLDLKNPSLVTVLKHCTFTGTGGRFGKTKHTRIYDEKAK